MSYYGFGRADIGRMAKPTKARYYFRVNIDGTSVIKGPYSTTDQAQKWRSNYQYNGYSVTPIIQG